METSKSAPVTTVVAFDVDKTLTSRDCVVPFLLRMITLRHAPRLLAGALPLGWAAVRGDRDQVKSRVTRMVLTGISRQHIDRVGESYATKVLNSWMRNDTMLRLQWHRQQGHRVVLVSASYSAYLRHVGAALQCDDVLSCEVEFDEFGRCTGRLIDGNCRGEEKERRLRGWMESSGLENAELFAYGDSEGDAHLLAMATWATRVTRLPIPETPSHIDVLTTTDRTSTMS